ncbi:Redoxin [Lactarius quietus]|nr:Redoxin [Lactarius quietus]
MDSLISSITSGVVQTATHAQASALHAMHPAKPGDKVQLNEVVKENDAAKVITLTLTGKNVFVGVPGAFTPTCSSQAPAYIEKYEEFKAKGVNEVFIVTVNDAYVTKAWKEKLAPDGTPVRFIADDRGVFVISLGLAFDATHGLGGVRAKRFVIITEGETIQQVLVEDSPSEVKVTEAANVLTQL